MSTTTPGTVNYAPPVKAIGSGINPPMRVMSVGEILLQIFPDEIIRPGQRLRKRQAAMLNSAITVAKSERTS